MIRLIRPSLFALLSAGLIGGAAPARPDDWSAQQALFAYDRAAPLDVVEKSVEVREGAQVRDVTFNALAGPPVGAFIVTPPGKGPFAAVLWVHWLGEPETTNRTQFLNEAVGLASKGVVSVLVDAMWAAPDWFGKRVPEEDYAHSISQVIALRRAMDLLIAQPRVDASRLGIVGHDYGGMYSMLMAGVDQRARACVYVAVVPSLNDWAFLGPQPKSKAAYLRQNALLELTDYLRQHQKAATLLQFGTKDVYVSRVDTAIIANAAGTKNRKFYETDHAMSLPEIREDRDAWLMEQLMASPAKQH